MKYFSIYSVLLWFCLLEFCSFPHAAHMCVCVCVCVYLDVYFLSPFCQSLDFWLGYVIHLHVIKLLIKIKIYAFPPSFLPSFLPSPNLTYGSSWARGKIRPAAVVYTTAMTTLDLSHTCDHCILWQQQILNPPSAKARDQTTSSWMICGVLNPPIHNSNFSFSYFYMSYIFCIPLFFDSCLPLFRYFLLCSSNFLFSSSIFSYFLST